MIPRSENALAEVGLDPPEGVSLERALFADFVNSDHRIRSLQQHGFGVFAWSRADAVCATSAESCRTSSFRNRRIIDFAVNNRNLGAREL